MSIKSMNKNRSFEQDLLIRHGYRMLAIGFLSGYVGHDLGDKHTNFIDYFEHHAMTSKTPPTLRTAYASWVIEQTKDTSVETELKCEADPYDACGLGN